MLALNKVLSDHLSVNTKMSSRSSAVSRQSAVEVSAVAAESR